MCLVQYRLDDFNVVTPGRLMQSITSFNIRGIYISSISY